MVQGGGGKEEEEGGGGRVFADAFEVSELWGWGEGGREEGRVGGLGGLAVIMDVCQCGSKQSWKWRKRRERN